MKRNRAPATIHEISVAAAMAALAATNLLLWQFAPLSTICMLLSSFPFTLIGMRERFKISILCVLIAMAVGFIIGGRILMQESLCVGILGICVGYTEKKEATKFIQLCVALWLGLLSAGGVLFLLSTFVQFRELSFQTIKAIIRSIATIIRFFGGHSVSRLMVQLSNLVLRHWVATALITVPIFVILAFFFVRLLFVVPLRSTNHYIPEIDYEEIPEAGEPHPVPIEFQEVSFHYQNSVLCTPENLNTLIPQHGLVSLGGENGAGKSTTIKLICGMLQPTSGKIIRGGSIGLGKHQGTAIIFQRPESQVLGMRIKDDLRFGNHRGSYDSRFILELVGLDGLEDRNTSDLSGGQLQRLAIAAALTRDPALLISDESTSMLDPSGREAMMNIYHKLSNDRCIIHISHNLHESEKANFKIDLSLPLQNMNDSALVTEIEPKTATFSTYNPDEHLYHNSLSIINVTKVYLPKTPWAHEALCPINLHIRSGEVIAITGKNGSGKTTLARIIAGLEKPTTGQVFLDGNPCSKIIDGSILLATQLSSSQLQAATVHEEICAYSPKSREECIQALDLVGLEEDILDAHPQTLSGGQQRRVVLASLFASDPRILILDEPLAGCDQESIRSINHAIQRFGQSGKTILVVTHDVDIQSGIFHRHIDLEEGQIVSDNHPAVLPESVQNTSATLKKNREVLRLRNIYGRVLPGDNIARNLWIGTKLYIMLATTVAVFARTDWYMFTTVALILFIWSCLIKLPRKAIPVPTRGFIILFILGECGIVFGNNKHVIHLGIIPFSLHGLNLACKYTFLCAVMFYSFMLFTYTTPIAEVSPFLQRIKKRFPHSPLIGGLCIGIALSLRQLSLISKEITTMRELSRQRIYEKKSYSFLGRILRTELSISLHSCALTIRLAHEMSLAIIARGGAGNIGAVDKIPQKKDYAIMIACTILFIIGIGFPPIF